MTELRESVHFVWKKGRAVNTEITKVALNRERFHFTTCLPNHACVPILILQELAGGSVLYIYVLESER